MIGERGINLSGGQKARVGMARCVYNPSSIVLMDSPLAAVDSHVGDHIFNECILGYLKGRTRILVTNQLHRLKNADHVIYLANGKIAAQGTYDDIVKISYKILKNHQFNLEIKRLILLISYNIDKIN